MFDSLSDRLRATLAGLTGRGRVTEADVDAAMREVRLALLEADVNFKVVKDVVGRIRERAVGTEILASLSAVIGGVVGFFALEQSLALLPFALAVAAASLLYIAVADLIPGLHRRTDPRSSVMQVVLIGLGVALVAFAERHAH